MQASEWSSIKRCNVSMLSEEMPGPKAHAGKACPICSSRKACLCLDELLLKPAVLSPQRCLACCSSCLQGPDTLGRRFILGLQSQCRYAGRSEAMHLCIHSRSCKAMPRMMEWSLPAAQVWQDMEPGWQKSLQFMCTKHDFPWHSCHWLCNLQSAGCAPYL